MKIETHVYYNEGALFCGTIKKGTYAIEADANKEGDRDGSEEE